MFRGGAFASSFFAKKCHDTHLHVQAPEFSKTAGPEGLMNGYQSFLRLLVLSAAS
jgi:hypothetical protein